MHTSFFINLFRQVSIYSRFQLLVWHFKWIHIEKNKNSPSSQDHRFVIVHYCFLPEQIYPTLSTTIPPFCLTPTCLLALQSVRSQPIGTHLVSQASYPTLPTTHQPLHLHPTRLLRPCSSLHIIFDKFGCTNLTNKIPSICIFRVEHPSYWRQLLWFIIMSITGELLIRWNEKENRDCKL